MTKRNLASSLDEVNVHLENHKLRPSNKEGKFLPHATQMVPILYKRGDHEGIIYRPTCPVCGVVILDLQKANVAVVNLDGPPWDSPLPSLGKLGEGEFFRIGGVAVTVHHDCDNRKWVPWIRATSVFSLDQRSPLEKEGWKAVAA